MTTVAVPGAVRRAVAWHRPLMLLTALMMATTVLSIGGLLVDDRILNGDPIWLKPFKFSISIAIYAATWTWMLSLQQRTRRWVWWSSTAIAILAGLEMVIIIGQVLRGRASHFNATSALDTTLFTIMGAAITGLWVLNLIQGVVLPRERLAERPLALAIKFGVAIGVVGIGLAFLMTGPTAEQVHALQHDLPVEAIGAHSVGVPDGGPGMPITGWSTTGGDLRIPHFVGIHAMQALPLLAMGLAALSRNYPRLGSTAVRSRLVLTGAATYAGLLALVTWQALRGQPLIAPDGWTLLAAGALAAVAVLGVRWSIAAGDITGDATDKPVEREVSAL